MTKLLISSCVLLVALPASAEEIPPCPIEVQKSHEGFLFSENGDKILFYQAKTKSLDGQYPRANYIHPLYDLNGNVLTEDFPADHLHQRGIYWTWHQLRIAGELIADPWICENIVWEIFETDVECTERQSKLRLGVYWKSQLPRGASGKSQSFQPIVKETTSICVHRQVDDMRLIDFEIQLLAIVDGVSIGGSEDEKGYGGLCARLRLPEALQFTGTKGTVTPEFTAVDAGPVVDFSNIFGSSNRVSGMAILCHPSLPQFPQCWILRQEKSMQNPVFPGRQAVALSRTNPTILRYRLAVHRGTLDSETLDALQQAYQAEAGLGP